LRRHHRLPQDRVDVLLHAVRRLPAGAGGARRRRRADRCAGRAGRDRSDRGIEHPFPKVEPSSMLRRVEKTMTVNLPGTNTRAAANRDLLAADTAMGPVTLLVGDLDLLTTYYVEGLALTVLRAEGNETVLGRAGEPIIVLRHDPA